LSAVLIFLNLRKSGAAFMILSTLFILATRDNFLLKTGGTGSRANNNSEGAQRMLDFFKHLSLLGIALLVIDDTK
jgi:hypothetical protein